MGLSKQHARDMLPHILNRCSRLQLYIGRKISSVPTNANLNQPQVVSEHILTYLLTPWCRVLLEKLTGLPLVKKFPAFHGTRRFITALTSVRHLSLSWDSPIQSIYPHPTSWRSILILSTHPRLGLPSVWAHRRRKSLILFKDC